jgi:hypothetical protein
MSSSGQKFPAGHSMFGADNPSSVQIDPAGHGMQSSIDAPP